MNCEHVEELLSAYLDNMLAAGEQREVAEHLNACASCSMLLNEYHHFDTMIAHLPRYSPSPALYLKLFSAAGTIDHTPLQR